MLLRIIVPVVVLLTSLNGFTQPALQRAQKEMSLFNYSKAVEILQKDIAKKDREPNFETTLAMADCYRMLNDVPGAKTWYALAIARLANCRSEVHPCPIVFFHYAQALRSAGEYALAKIYFLRYDSIVQGQQRGRLFADYCDSAVAWQALKPEFETRNPIGLNTPQSEFGAVFYPGGILFASDRISATTAGKIYGWTGNSYLNLYSAAPVHADSIFGDFTSPLPFSGLSGQGWHEGPVTFNQGFTKIFINQTQLTHDKGKKDPGPVRTHLLKIFYAEKQDGKWSAAEPFFLNSENYSVGHPALTKDRKTLYFVSDMPGGYGETDIWYCIYGQNSWSAPINPGPAVNTAGKEMFPFAAANGDLYYASDGLPGFGGLDLFVTRNTESHWSTPHNLGWPVNSSWDDFSLSISGNNDGGLFSSNRPGGAGSDDIYCFRKILPVQIPPVSPGPPAIAVSVVNGTPVKSLSDTLEINKSYRLENIFYDFDKWDIRADAIPSLDKLVSIMEDYPITIELGSHTDCRGSESYNMDLSQKRAESAVQYIISRGISPSRILARGYGKTKLLNRCDCAAGNGCSEPEHQFNRRTEFMVTGRNGK
ncbi:MAG: OmpA family protein [Bacteroidetes bacterium]|nr:OmpA family protein [Bacteroidota bacterium]